MIIIKKNISYFNETLAIYGFFLTLAISIWAVRTPNSTLGSDSLRFILKIIFYLLIIIEFTITFLLRKKIKVYKIMVLIAIWPIIYWAYIHLWSFEVESLAITSPIIAFMFALQNNNVKKKVFILFKKLLVLISLIGIVCYFSYCFKIPIPYSIEPYYDGRPNQNYVNYFNLSFLYINNTSLRMCGIFNEPGWLGTTIGLMLCYEEFEFKKISNWILLIAGLLTYSLAFIIIMIIGFVMRNIDKIKKWILLFFCLYLIIFILPSIKTNNKQLNMLISRMKITQTGLAGNNRSSETVDVLLQETLSSNKCLFGYGDGYAEYINKTKESKQILTIKTELINLGIIGTFLNYIVPLFFFLLLPHINRKSLIYIICFWISLYQRPWLYIVSNYMMILSVVSYLTTENTPVLEINKPNFEQII